MVGAEPGDAGETAELTVFRLSSDDTQALAALANRAMSLQCMIQDGEMLVTGEGDAVRIEPAILM